MANHKRRRPKNRRAGCLFCKPHKANGAKRQQGHLRRQMLRALANTKEQLSGVD